MTNRTMLGGVALLLAALVAPLGCGGDSSSGPQPEPTPSNMPVIPVPSSPSQALPDRSDVLAIGMSGGLASFVPYVSELRVMRDDGALEWVAKNRHVILACPAVLPSSSAQTDAPYISARPRLLHTRYWRRLDQNTLSPGTSYTLSKRITWGASSTKTESKEFSETLGVEVSTGVEWNGVSAAIKTSYSATATIAEVNSVTFFEETSQERSFTVQAPSGGTRVYALWQLVDVFTIVDANRTPIHQSPTLTNVRMPAIAVVEFPNENILSMKTTDFK